MTNEKSPESKGFHRTVHMCTILTIVQMLYLFEYLLVDVLVYRITFCLCITVLHCQTHSLKYCYAIFLFVRSAFCCLSFALLLKISTLSVRRSTFAVGWFTRHHAPHRLPKNRSHLIIFSVLLHSLRVFNVQRSSGECVCVYYLAAFWFSSPHLFYTAGATTAQTPKEKAYKPLAWCGLGLTCWGATGQKLAPVKPPHSHSPKSFCPTNQPVFLCWNTIPYIS